MAGGDPIEAALLEAIRVDPQDTQARLIYADWLMQRGDVRGEYIATACRAETEARARELWAAHGARWLDALPAWLRTGPRELERGFVSSVTFAGKLEQLVAPERLVQLLAIAPVPGVALADGRWALMRPDGRVCCVVSHHEDGRRIEVAGLPWLRILASLDISQLPARVWFARDRDVLMIDAPPGPAPRELPFASSR